MPVRRKKDVRGLLKSIARGKARLAKKAYRGGKISHDKYVQVKRERNELISLAKRISPGWLGAIGRRKYAFTVPRDVLIKNLAKKVNPEALEHLKDLPENVTLYYGPLARVSGLEAKILGEVPHGGLAWGRYLSARVAKALGVTPVVRKIIETGAPEGVEETNIPGGEEMPIRKAKRENLIERAKNLKSRHEELINRARKVGMDVSELEKLPKTVDNILKKAESGTYKGVLGTSKLDKFEEALNEWEKTVLKAEKEIRETPGKTIFVPVGEERRRTVFTPIYQGKPGGEAMPKSKVEKKPKPEKKPVVKTEKVKEFEELRRKEEEEREKRRELLKRVKRIAKDYERLLDRVKAEALKGELGEKGINVNRVENLSVFHGVDDILDILKKGRYNDVIEKASAKLENLRDFEKEITQYHNVIDKVFAEHQEKLHEKASGWASLNEKKRTLEHDLAQEQVRELAKAIAPIREKDVRELTDIEKELLNVYDKASKNPERYSSDLSAAVKKYLQKKAEGK